MALDPVVKVEITAHKSVADEILEELQSLSMLQIDPHTIKQWECDKAEIEQTSQRIVELKKELIRLERAINFIGKYEPKVSILARLSYQPDELSKNDLKGIVHVRGACRLLDEIHSMEQELGEVDGAIRDLLQKKSELMPYLDLAVPLELLAKKGAAEIIVSKLRKETFEELSRTEANKLIQIERISGEELVYFYVIYHREAEDSVEQLRKEHRFEPISLAHHPVSAAELMREYESSLSSLEKRKQDLLTQIRGKVEEASLLRHYYDYLRTEIEKESAKEKFFYTEKVFVINGWARKKDFHILSSAVGAHQEAAVAEIAKEEAELAPTAYRNNKIVSPFEMIVNLFSPPGPRDIDPTPFVAPFYSLFFAVCLTEGGYGVIMTVLSLFILFVLKPRGNFRRFVNFFLILGIASIIVGIPIGTIFGINFNALPENLAWLRDARNKLLVFDSGTDVLTFFGFCLGVGVLHLITAYLIKFFMLLRDGDVMSAVCDQLPYVFLLLAPVPKLLQRMMPEHAVVLNYIFFALLGLWAFIILFFAERSTLNPIKRIGKGLFTLYGVTSVLGDVLSYSRLLALGIATGVIASAVNVIAGIVKQIPVVGMVAFVPVLIIGHLGNLATSSMSAFVHSVRLEFLEFFGKFYAGDGRLFTPFAEVRKYSLVKMGNRGLSQKR